MSERIGIVTGGGDCPGLNAVIRAAARPREAGLGDHRLPRRLRGDPGAPAVHPPRLPEAGRPALPWGDHPRHRQPGEVLAKVGHGETRRLPQELIDGVKEGMRKQGIRALISIGGDGSLSIAQQLFEGGVPVVGVPKTIDNDLAGTSMTFGRLGRGLRDGCPRPPPHDGGEPRQVLVLEVMGRYAGWIAIYAGVAGGADVILIPRSPSTSRASPPRSRSGRRREAVLPGHRRRGGEGGGRRIRHAAEQAANREARLGGIGAVVAAEIEKRTGKETRTCVLGHLQRGGSRRTSTARCARSSGPRRWNSSRRGTTGRWWRSRARG